VVRERRPASAVAQSGLPGPGASRVLQPQEVPMNQHAHSPSFSNAWCWLASVQAVALFSPPARAAAAHAVPDPNARVRRAPSSTFPLGSG
jgi:hypothetical protein